MPGGDSTDGAHRGVSRRQFLGAAGATGAAAGLSGCASVHPISIGSRRETGRRIKWAADSTIAGQSDAIQKALHEAGLPPDIHVEIIAGATQTGARQSQYQRWLSANLPEPDLLMMDSGWALTFIARRQVLNLEEEMPASFVRRVKNDYFRASVSTAEATNGDLYAVPLFPDFPTMQYRRDLVKEAGYDPEGENWATESMTWKRFSKITKDVVETTGTRYGFTFQADVYEGLACCDFNEFMSGWGGAYFGGLENLFGPIGDRPVTVDEDAVLNSVKMIRTFLHGPDAANTLDGYAGPISPQGVLQWTEEPSRKPFTSGDAVMHRNWPYSIIINGADDVFGTDLGVMPIPYAVSETDAKYDGTGGPVAALGGWHMTVNPNSRDLDACRAVLRAMMKREFKLKLFQAVGLIPPEPKILEPDAVTEIPVIGRHIDAIRVAGQNAVPRPVRAVWPLESTKTAQSVHAAYAGDGAPSEALASLKRDLGMIERYNQSP